MKTKNAPKSAETPAPVAAVLPVVEPYHKTLPPHLDLVPNTFSYSGPKEWTTKDGRLHCISKEAPYSPIRMHWPEYQWIISLDGEKIAVIPEGKVGDVYQAFADYLNGKPLSKDSFTAPMPRSGESEYRLDFNDWEGTRRVHYDEVPAGQLKADNARRLSECAK